MELKIGYIMVYNPDNPDNPNNPNSSDSPDNPDNSNVLSYLLI